MQDDGHTCTHVTLVFYSVLTVKLRKNKKVRHKKKKKKGCAKALCHQGSKTVREESRRAVRNRSRKETAVIKEGFNYFAEGEGRSTES